MLRYHPRAGERRPRRCSARPSRAQQQEDQRLTRKQRLTRLEARQTSAGDIAQDAALFTAKMAALAERMREDQGPGEDMKLYPADYLDQLLGQMGLIGAAAQ